MALTAALETNKTLLILSLLLIAAAGTAAPQVAVPTPARDPHVFIDAAMTFIAPPGARPQGAWPASRTTPDQLSAALLTVATWEIYPNRDQIKLEMESYSGPPSEWEPAFEEQVRGGDGADAPFFRNKTRMRLLNGMPATFVEIDFDSRSGTAPNTVFAILWADGRRGIVLSETMPANDASGDKAKRDLRQVKAVEYP